MKLSLRLRLAWRILFHIDANVHNNYFGRVCYCIGLPGSRSRRSFEIVIRSEKYLAERKHV